MKDAIQMPLIARAEHHAGRAAIVDTAGTHTYSDLLAASARVAAALLEDRDDLRKEQVAFLVAPSFAWVAVQWGIWRAGGIAVPLPVGAPAAELEYLLDDTQASSLIYDKANEAIVESLGRSRGIRTISCDEAFAHPTGALPAIGNHRRAMILYTSGTTSRPKGVVTTHANITAQIKCLIEAWEWSPDDRIILCLPLHHVHGIINVLSCALWAGAVCEMLPRFDAGAVWERIGGGDTTLVMAVPTIYVRLIAAWEASASERRRELSKAAAKLRLMVSGSAALPVTTLHRWREITGHTLLERYGMTEIGMVLSNSYRADRIPGSVGRPLPGVKVQLVNDVGAPVAPGAAGEIEIRGANVFLEYWCKPEATREAFRDGWFRTGDTAVVEDGVYRILGRTNIDILKTGGHKVSALEIEEALRDHPAIVECAVVGITDQEWGERVGAALVLRDGKTLELEELREWAKQRLATHKVPSRLLLLEALPRNAMGKVTKPAVKSMFEGKAEIS
jgi:malonyl-CoA/methylmalonyl-CoA synthetase